MGVNPRKSSFVKEKLTNEERKEEKSKQAYTYFKDKADGSHSYKGDGTEQVKFFNEHSNYNELIEGMTKEEREWFSDYWAPGMFMSGQQYRGWDSMSDSYKRATQTYDDVLDKSVFNKGLVVVRRATAELILGKGNKYGSLNELQAMKGQEVISRGNMSCGVASQGLTIGASKNVEYKIFIPKGAKGAGMWIGDHRINGWGAKQREFMTNRDIRLKVGKTTYDSDRGVYVVELKYNGGLVHDYGTSGRMKPLRHVELPPRRSRT